MSRVEWLARLGGTASVPESQWGNGHAAPPRRSGLFSMIAFAAWIAILTPVSGETADFWANYYELRVDPTSDVGSTWGYGRPPNYSYTLRGSIKIKDRLALTNCVPNSLSCLMDGNHTHRATRDPADMRIHSPCDSFANCAVTAFLVRNQAGVRDYQGAALADPAHAKRCYTRSHGESRQLYKVGKCLRPDSANGTGMYEQRFEIAVPEPAHRDVTWEVCLGRGPVSPDGLTRTVSNGESKAIELGVCQRVDIKYPVSCSWDSSAGGGDVNLVYEAVRGRGVSDKTVDSPSRVYTCNIGANGKVKLIGGASEIKLYQLGSPSVGSCKLDLGAGAGRPLTVGPTRSTTVTPSCLIESTDLIPGEYTGHGTLVVELD